MRRLDTVTDTGDDTTSRRIVRDLQVRYILPSLHSSLTNMGMAQLRSYTRSRLSKRRSRSTERRRRRGVGGRRCSLEARYADVLYARCVLIIFVCSGFLRSLGATLLDLRCRAWEEGVGFEMHFLALHVLVRGFVLGWDFDEDACFYVSSRGWGLISCLYYSSFCRSLRLSC